MTNKHMTNKGKAGEQVWEGNKAKHLSKNPLIKYVMRQFNKDVVRIVKSVQPKTILDTGCGEGFTISKVADTLPHTKITAVDLETAYVAYAKKHNSRKNITFMRGDLYNLPFTTAKKQTDLVMCNEVLEHLEDYEKAIKTLLTYSKKYVLISVPREPWWRMANIARLRYLKNLGNTPGHLNNWTKGSIRRLISKHATVRKVKASTLWTIVLFEKRR